jgi:hypothetical protein
MTAGRGIIHSEMPQQVEGRMRGFQLWINLPAAEKMKPAAYQDLEPERVPRAQADGATVRVVAGTFRPLAGGAAVAGPIAGGRTAPVYLDVGLEAGAKLSLATEPGHTLVAYVFEGEATIAGEKVGKGQLARLTEGDALELAAPARATRLLVIGGRPLKEPVVHYGPFVMNTVAEIEQAVRDFRDGRLIQ